MIGILVAASKEWKVVLEHFNIGKVEKYLYGEYFKTFINNKEVTFFKTGTRKTNASASTQYIIDHYNIDKVIVIGTCAGVDASNKLLDVIIPNKVLQSDVTFMERGEAPKEDFIVELREIKGYKNGLLASSDKPLVDKEISDMLYKNGVSIVDMEGAPIAYVCKINNIPCTIIKGISDFPGKYIHFCDEQFEEYINNLPIVINKILNDYIDKFI